MIKLLPCPFCGGEAYYRKPQKVEHSAFVWLSVECKKCGASPYGINAYEDASEEDKQNAIAKLWNRRCLNA